MFFDSCSTTRHKTFQLCFDFNRVLKLFNTQLFITNCSGLDEYVLVYMYIDIAKEYDITTTCKEIEEIHQRNNIVNIDSIAG